MEYNRQYIYWKNGSAVESESKPKSGAFDDQESEPSNEKFESESLNL